MSIKRKTVNLSDLCGAHALTGVEDAMIEVEGSWRGKQTVNVMRFVLDGKTYHAQEDPDDGYRSHCKDVMVDNTPVSNTFPPCRVLGRMREDSAHEQNDVLQLIDISTGKVVLEVGTGNTSDYYPYYVAAFDPAAMAINAGPAPEIGISTGEKS